MPVVVSCQCGASYDLRDEFAGQTVTCPTCGSVNRASRSLGGPGALDPVFDRDVFLLRQQHLAIKEKYIVFDERGGQLLYVERPRHLGRNVAALLGAILAGAVVAGFLVSVGDSLMSVPAKLLFTAMGAAGAVTAAVVVYAQLVQKRHVAFHKDGPNGTTLLEVLQNDTVVLVTSSYTVTDGSGRLLATLRKHHLYDIIRKRWQVFNAQGALVCVAQEDSLFKSVLRRLLGPMLGLLRTNFVFTDPKSGRPLGEFLRKFTLLDRYVLTLARDPGHVLDRRVALALGVMLDTGERR